jgi:molybdopterin synthase catalytic subunit
MRVSVRLFAGLRERAGADRVEIDLPEGARVADVLAAMATTPVGELRPRECVVAVNREYAEPHEHVQAGDEVALVPPVSGGADPHVRVGPDPISLEELSARVAHPDAGAVVSFEGMPREVAALDYEAYVEMAEHRIAAILRECTEDHGLVAAAAEHRTGTVPLGEASVVVCVSAPHRPEAFAGAREAIDRIKAETPIWKREVERRA